MNAIVDLRPLIDGVVFPILQAVLVPIAGGAATWAMVHLGKAAHVQVTQHQMATVEAAMNNGIKWALSRAQTAADQNAVVTPKEAIIAMAANYALPKIPTALSSLGITPQGLAERIEARLAADFKPVSPNA
jgi:hypothetical protein